jgi:2-oxoglutarate ferredoxin oxidoreductase subunit beta
MSEILAETAGAVYVTREMATDIASIRRTKRAIKRAFLTQMEGLGFACVEVLATCPTNWNVDPWSAMEWVKETMASYYPVETFKMTDEVKALKVR